MPKTGRNDPCPCGSGKKYKHCCWHKHEQSGRAARAAASPALGPGMMKLQALVEERELATASNAVIALVRAGKLDEAEQAAHELLERYPEVHDGYDRLGMVYEARGDFKQAAECYRKVIAFVRDHPDQYEPQFEATFQRLVAKLDPPASN